MLEFGMASIRPSAAVDNAQFLEDIVEIIHFPSYPTASKRHDAMVALLDRMGEQIDPRYSRKIAEITKANVHAFGSRVK